MVPAAVRLAVIGTIPGLLLSAAMEIFATTMLVQNVNNERIT
jgi:hypothetical protein